MGHDKDLQAHKSTSRPIASRFMTLEKAVGQLRLYVDNRGIGFAAVANFAKYKILSLWATLIYPRKFTLGSEYIPNTTTGIPATDALHAETWAAADQR